MNDQRIDFIEELLLQAEQADQDRKIEMDRLQSDRMLAAIAAIEEDMAAVNDLCDKEVRTIEEYRSKQVARLDKKQAWLIFNLEGFMRATGEKTLRLPHGQLKLRKGRDRVAVVAIEQFLKVGRKLGLVKEIPESVTPDLQAILNHFHCTGEVPPGIQVIPAEVRFTYSTNGGSTDDAE